LAGRPIDADARAHLEGVPLDSRLKLLETVVGEPHRTVGEEHRRQRDIKWERRVVASAESPAAISKISVDAGRLESRQGVAEQIGDRFRGLVRRLRADDELEVFAAGVIPGKAAFRLEKHRIDRLRLEFAIEHQQRRVVGCEFRADFFAIARRFRIGLPGGSREARPDRTSRAFEEPWTDPAVLDRRIELGRARGRAPYPRATELADSWPFD